MENIGREKRADSLKKQKNYRKVKKKLTNKLYILLECVSIWELKKEFWDEKVVFKWLKLGIEIGFSWLKKWYVHRDMRETTKRELLNKWNIYSINKEVLKKNKKEKRADISLLKIIMN